MDDVSRRRMENCQSQENRKGVDEECVRHAPREAVVGDVVASNIPHVFIVNVIEYKFTYVVSLDALKFTFAKFAAHSSR